VFFPVSEWFPAFLLTVAVEAPVVGVLLRAVERSLARLAVLFVFANLATHLVVWYVMTQLFLVTTPEYVLASEGWAIAGEALFYVAAIRGLSARRAVGVAVVANLASMVAGRLVFAAWPDLLA
jgi:hypothetical protein